MISNRISRAVKLPAIALLTFASVRVLAQGMPFGGGAPIQPDDTTASSPAGSSAAQMQLTQPRSIDVIRSSDRLPARAPMPVAIPGSAVVAPSQAVSPAIGVSGVPGSPYAASAQPAPPPEPTEFQTFVATSVGRELPIFGQDLFTNPATSFAPVDVPPAFDYVIGPGDEIVVRAWGQVEIDVHAVVSREGTISIPRIGVLPVAGTRYEQLPTRIRATISRYYRAFELSVSLGQLRSIQVFVLGHAKHPGLYTLSSMSTLLNALLACGGPSATGSMRSIQLRRGDQTITAFDLYDVLMKGDKSHDMRLLTGDVVFVPPAGSLAAVAGPVKRPAIYELGTDTSLSELLLEYAGGFTTMAATRSVLLERLDQQRGRVAAELEWDDTTSRSVTVRDGDVIQLRYVPTRFENSLTLRGSVVEPFRTAWRPGVRVTDLIPDASALISRGYWSRAAARAFDSDRLRATSAATETGGLDQRTGTFPIQASTFPGQPTSPSQPSTPSGRVAPSTSEALNQQQLKTDVANLVDEVNWDYAVVERLDRTRLTPKLVPFNLGRAVLDHDPENNLALEPGDIVTVFSKKDILAPASNRTNFVRVEGEVNIPGVYQVTPGETLKALLKRIGGFTPKAYLFGAEFEREAVRIEQQRRLEEVVTRAQQELDRAAQDRFARALTPEDAQTVRLEVENQRRAIARINALHATGRMVLELSPHAATIDDLPDIVLQDGDRFFVPEQYSTVGVYGAVYNQSNLLYRRGRNVGEYLRSAGGPTRGADKGSIYVLRADGSVISKRQTGWFSSFDRRELMPNDNIVVPEEYAPTSWVKELKDWSQIFYQFGLGIAALKVLGL